MRALQIAGALLVAALALLAANAGDVFGQLTTFNRPAITGSSLTGTVPRVFNVICQSGAAVSAPADTTEDTLATCTIPAGAIGPNGTLRIWTLWTVNNNAGDKTPRIRFSGAAGTVFGGGFTLANLATWQTLTTITNRNSQSSQVGSQATAAVISTSTAAAVTASVDTSVATSVVITCQKLTGSDTCTLERYLIEVLYGA